jgi:predicted RNase H-related nuclease YkuK (DUF458 family)
MYPRRLIEISAFLFNFVLWKSTFGQTVHIIDYSIQRISMNSDTKIFIGTDSQVDGAYIDFYIAIAYRSGNNGVHCIYKHIRKERPPKKVSMEKQVEMRLREEMEMTIEIAKYIMENSSLKIEALEFDYNDVLPTLSHIFAKESLGWCQELCVKHLSKPDEMYATKYANSKCQ